MTRLLLPAALLVLLGFTVVVELFYVDPAQQRRNFTVWQNMNAGQRAAAEEAWARLEDLGPGERERLLRRAAILSRLQARAKRVQGEFLDQPELEAYLGSIPAHLATALGVESQDTQDDEALSRLIQDRTRERLDAFLANLAETSGRIDADDIERLDGLPWTDFVRSCLELRKSEEIYLYSEVAEPSSWRLQAEVSELQRLDPLDALHCTEESRLRLGMLGRIARLLDLDEAEREELAQLPEDSRERRTRQLLEPHVRALMERLDVPEARQQKILRRPWRDLERAVNRLLHEGS